MIFLYLHGRVSPEELHKLPNTSWDAYGENVFGYRHWSRAIKKTISKLNPQYIIMNAGFHPHHFGNKDSPDRKELVPFLQNISSLQKAFWKTTTFMKDHTLVADAENTDALMCQLLDDCFNVSWTARLRPEYYIDRWHMQAPAYRVMNEDLLEQLLGGSLPLGYQRFDPAPLLLK
jgi:hypothetical protein